MKLTLQTLSNHSYSRCSQMLRKGSYHSLKGREEEEAAAAEEAQKETLSPSRSSKREREREGEGEGEGESFFFLISCDLWIGESETELLACLRAWAKRADLRRVMKWSLGEIVESGFGNMHVCDCTAPQNRNRT
eukprot:TRINITY_DN3636_c0_g1_i3.p1 TRINITY_DN3636_c0_g1~~TRINITY_DN3636_c0_g1_i3.p1  ORF type:complete len:134 (+),score=34.02 TRINITY_DN3636_c0_g1_i3:1229-1630(+)